MSEKPFRILQKYLHDTNAALTQDEIAFRLDNKNEKINDVVRKWASRGFAPSATTGITANDIVETFFKEKSIQQGFVVRLRNLKYDISDYFPNGDLQIDDFTILVREFLAENVERKSKDEFDYNFLKKQKNYFSQALSTYDEINDVWKSIFDFNKPDFSAIKLGKRFLIEGPGGQGKSLFLQKLRDKAIECNFRVFHIELADLPDIKEDLKKFRETELPYFFSYLSSFGNLADATTCLLGTQSDTPTDTYILLDGLNELMCSPDANAIYNIANEITYITENSEATIIMTSRASVIKNKFRDIYTQCRLSGTPEDKLNQFFAENSEMNGYIKSLAEIPLYYNSLVKINNKNEIKTKYDLLFNMFIDKYKQAKRQSMETFIAFFVFSPLFFQYLTGQNKHSNIRKSDVLAFSREIKNMSLDSFIMCAQEECKMYFHSNEFDYKKVMAIFLSDVVDLHTTINGEEIYKLHDEFRDFLQVFYHVILLKVSRASLDGGDYTYVRDLDGRINLNDNACQLLKQKLGLHSGADLYKLTEFSALTDCKLSPQAFIYAHSCFYLADNLGFKDATTPAHDMLIGFTERVCRLVEQGNFENCLKDNNTLISPEQRIRCINAFLDVVTKHCEHYRLTGDEESGIKLIKCVEKIDENYNPILHQKAKLLLTIFEKHIKDKNDFDLTSLGFTDYDQLYHDALCLLKKASDARFAFSSILLAFLKSNPPIYMLENTNIEIDYVDAFNLYRSVIFDDSKKFVFKRVSYTIRNLLGLLLIKGYIRIKPGFFYEDGDPGSDAVTVGDMNMLTLDNNTLKFAEYILEKYAVGVYDVTSLNYCRAVVEYHKGNFLEAQRYLKLEKEKFLTSAFNHYVFNEPLNLDALCNELRTEILNPEKNSIEGCHPLYWHVDLKKLVLAFDKSKVAFFNQFEKTLPENIQKIINRIT